MCVCVFHMYIHNTRTSVNKKERERRVRHKTQELGRDYKQIEPFVPLLLSPHLTHQG